MESNTDKMNNITRMTEAIYYESAKMILRRKSLRKVILLLSVVTVILTLLVIYLFRYEVDTITIIITSYIAMMWLFVIWFYIDLLTYKNKRIYRKQTKNAQARIYNYTFEDEYITAVWQTGTSTVFYDQLSAIYETKNTYILIADQNQKIRVSLVIDKTGFSSSSCDDFLRFLQKRVTIPIKS